MGETNLQFRENNPGAVSFGNFINYYEFHPTNERIKLLPTDIWKSKGVTYCLDIGCNSGDLTIAFREFLLSCGCSDCEVLGIDLDPILIERAIEKCSLDHIKFVCMDIMDSNALLHIENYLHDKKIKQFDVVSCFSISMWIHLNNGDSGLETFLNTVSQLSKLLLVEPQPWKCYKSAVKRMKKVPNAFPLFKSLKYRENVELDIEKFLTTKCKRVKILETESTVWDRKLMFFR